MTHQHDPLIARLESWLSQDDGSALSERVMDAVNIELLAIQQLRVGWRRFLPTSGIAKASYAVAGLAIAAVLILGYTLWASDDVGEPSPSPEPSVSDRPEPTSGQSTVPVTVGLDVGGVGIVVATEPLVIRSAPGTGLDSIILEGSLWPGMRFGIVEGPVVASGHEWYFIRAGELEGWAAMASREGEPWMASVVNGVIAYGGFAATTSGNVDDWAMELRAIAPGHEPSLIASLSYDDLQPQTDLDSAAGGGAVDCPGGLGVAWSPWGDRIALAAHSGCNGVIYTLNADGTGRMRHSDGTAPMWSPDGTRIAFGLNAPWFPCGPSCYEYPPGGWEVQVAEVDGGAPTSLTDSPAWTRATSPLWSPDGGTLAFLSADLSEGSLASLPPNEVHLINADGTGQRFLTDGQAVGWAPDGRSLLVYRVVNRVVNRSTRELWVVRIDGSGEILLPLQFTGGGQVAWSPDGSRLAVSGWNEESGSQTYLVSPDGSDITPIAVAGTVEGWSPDGRVILLSREGPEGKIELVWFTSSETHVEVVGAGIFLGFAWQPVLVYPAS